jgi:Tfp pilus assembly protein PilN
MITINLISGRRAEQAKYRRLGETLIRATVLVVLATATYLFFGFLSIRGMGRETEQANLQKVAFKQQADEVYRLRDARSALLPRVELVKTSQRRLDHWQYLYAQVARSVPANARLESVNITQAPDNSGKTMDVVGRGDNAYVLSQMLLALNTQPGFSDLAMGPVNMSTPHQAQVNAKLSIKPLPEDAPAPAATSATGPQ